MADENVSPKSEDKIDEKSTKIAFLKQFKNLAVDEKEVEENTQKKGILSHETGTEAKEKLNDDLKQNNHEYWTIVIKKKMVLWFIGLIIGGMWLTWLGQWLWTNYQGKIHFGKGVMVIEQTVEQPDVVVTPTGMGPKIRIRDTISDATGAAALKDQLRLSGFENVEVVQDSSSEFSGVSVVVKVDGLDLKLKLEEVLKQNYEVTSPSAELTADSDFDAVVFYGTHAKVTTKNN